MALKKPYNPDEPRGRIAGIFILVIMILSLAGFAVLSGAPQSSNSNSANPNVDVPLGQIFKNSQTGQQYWGAVIGGKKFIFQNGIDKFQNDTKMLNLAENLKNSKNIQIYLDPKFNSSDAQFMIERGLTAIKKPYSYSFDSTCTKNKLILTNDLKLTGNCDIFSVKKGTEYNRSVSLIYYLIK